MAVAAPGHDKTEDAVASYQAGDLIIDMGRQRVLRGAQEIPLPKLSFDLLLALVRAAPNVVTLDALVEQVWPGVVVGPETLSQRISLLREALDDDSRKPRYIASLRSRGYRFIPAVVRDGHEMPLAPSLRRRRLFLAGALSLAAVIAALFVVHSARRPNTDIVANATMSALPAHTVAVLPFQNLTTDAAHDSDVIAFGIAEGLLHRLASMRDLTLIARTSSFAAAAAPTADAQAIGRKLNAKYLIEGSVQRSGERLRITAQLIDATTGAHVWSLRFDRTVDDIFAVEDEITQNVAQALRVTLTQTRHPYARFGIEAYLALLQGRALVASRKPADAIEAIKRFERAIEIAPDFAVAYVDLANAHVHLAHLSTLYLSDPNRDAIERARPLVAKALQLDDTLGEAYVLRGFIEAFDGDSAQAAADYRRGLGLATNYALGFEQFAEFLQVDLQRFDEALAAIDRARLVDPFGPRVHYIKGRMLAEVGAFEEAEALYLRALEIAPDYYPALLRLGEIRTQQGRFADAVQLGERAAAIESTVQWVPFVLAEFYLDSGDVGAARAVLGHQADDVQWTSLCMFDGKIEHVAAVAANPAFEAVEPYEDEFLPFALRDAALAPGRPEEPRQILISRWERLRARPPSNEFWATRIAFAQLQLALGNRNEAQQLARALLQIDDPHAALGIQYARPYAYVLLDDRNAAIRALEQNVERGYLKRWWYTFERDPSLRSALGNDPRFRTLAERVRRHAASERALLEQRRARGEVPTRKADMSVVRASC